MHFVQSLFYAISQYWDEKENPQNFWEQSKTFGVNGNGFLKPYQQPHPMQILASDSIMSFTILGI